MSRRLASINFLCSANSRSRRTRRARRRPALEILERYRLLSQGIFSVVTTADNGNNASPTSGSLRWAIEQADALAAGDTAEIEFAVSSGGVQPVELTLASGGNPLPSLTIPTFINGFSEGVYDGIAGYTGSPLVEIAGSLVPGQDGITLSTGSSGSTIQGLSIVNFTESGGSGGAAIYVDPTSQDDLVENNNLGLLSDGATAAPNNIGIEVSSSGNTIGGTSASAGNVVSGNLTGGILLLEQYTSGTQIPLLGNFIGGNFVGTTAAGAAALPNGTSPSNAAGEGFGIGVAGATGTTIAGNVASGNELVGISLTDLGTNLSDTAPSRSTLLMTDDNVITGNLIGTDSTGQSPLGNNTGIEISGASGTTIGGTASGAGNVIAANLGYGIDIAQPTAPSADVIENNLIGTTTSGATSASPASGNQAGGIVLNGETGIAILGNTIENNPFAGIYSQGSTGVTIGGTTAAMANTIAANGDYGIEIDGDSTDLIEGNRIGAFAGGLVSASSGNAKLGIFGFGCTDTTVGGTAAGAANLIAGNDQFGLGFEDMRGFLVDGNTIESNKSGGVYSTSAHSSTASFVDNTISGNQGAGIYVIASYIDISLQGNQIEHNTGEGVSIQQSTTQSNLPIQVFIEDDQILSNTKGGIFVTQGEVKVLLQGSEIADNAGPGVLLNESNATIGGTYSGAADVIADNSGAGIAIMNHDFSPQNIGDLISGNSIFGNLHLGIDLGDSGAVLPNGSPVDDPNKSQNYPILTAVEISGSTAIASGTLIGYSNKTYTLEFFSNTTADRSGHGQGQTYLTTATVATASNGVANFEIPLGPVNFGSIVSATATDLYNNTSEFSPDITALSSTTTTLSSSANPSVYAQAVTLTATVSVDAPDSGAPSGTINFFDGATLLNSTPVPLSLVGGQYRATFSTSSLAVNSTSGYSITAVYSGDTDTLSSQSTPLVQLVDPDQTVTSLATSKSPSAFGMSVTFTATVSVTAPGSSAPTGTISFFEGATLLNSTPATLSLVSGQYQATFSTASMAVNATSGYSITAFYSGDTDTAGSQSAPLVQLVDPDQTATSVATSLSPSAFGQSVTFAATVTVTAPDAAPPTGTINFFDGVTLLNSNPATLSVVDGQYQASFSTTSLAVNSTSGHAITAVYSGDTDTASSQSTALVQLVDQDQTTTSVTTSQSPSVFGQSVTFTATVSVTAPGSSTPTGTINFFDGGTLLSATPASLGLVGGHDQASFSITSLAVNATSGHSITAVYSGDADTFGSQSTALVQLVDQDQTTTSVTTSQSPAAFGQSVTFTATVTVTTPGSSTPIGTINFFDAGTLLSATPVSLSLVGGHDQASFSITSLAVNATSGHSITAVYSGDSDTLGSQSTALAQLVDQDQTATSVTTSQSPSVFGQSVTFTATVSVTAPGSSIPTGTINFLDGGTLLNATPATLSLVGSHYEATFSTAALAVNSTSGHSITAVYSGDTDTHGSQSTPLAQLVDQDQTTTSVATSPSPSVFGQSVTLTATVNVTAPGSSTPTGTVNFLDGSTLLNATPATLSLIGGQYQASFSTTSLAVNSTSGHSITAVYSGDTDTLGSQSSPLAQLVDQDQTATSVTPSVTPSVFGQSVTFTATVSVTAPGSSSPTGTINFLDGSTLLNATPATLSLIGGQYQASFSTTSLAVNSTSGHSITAVYSGDTNTHGSQSSPLAQLVDQDQTTTSVATSQSPSVFGQSVTLTTTVNVTAPGSSTPTGTVNFLDGSTLLNAAPATLSLIGGQYRASYSMTSLAVNSTSGHSITAVYSGDTDTLGSLSPPLTQLVDHDQTATTVTTSTSPSVFGQSVTFTATVSVTAPGSGTPTGTINFLNDSTLLTSTPVTLSLVDGRYQATCSTSALAVNSTSGYSITAVYSGDTDTAGSQSVALAQLVDQDQTATTVATSLNPSAFGQSVTFTATVSVMAPGSSTPSGTINFFDGAMLLNSTPAALSLVSGHYEAFFSTSTLGVNSTSGYSITASYSGDTDTQNSQSPPLIQLVDEYQTSTSITTSLNHSSFGQSVAFTATVSVIPPGSAVPTGTVNFLDGNTLLNSAPATLSLVGGQYQASFSTASLAVNSTSGHSITAVYSGDNDTAASQSTALTQLVDQDQTATTVTTSASPSAFGQSVTFTASVSVTAPGSSTPSGTINFLDGGTLLNPTPATVSLVAGQYLASFSTSSLAVNSTTGHSITAVYSGDNDTAASLSSPLTQLVDQDQTATTVTTSSGPSVFGQPVTFTATVSVATPGSGTPTGTINFLDGTTPLNSTPATLSLVGGDEQASFSIPTLAVNSSTGHSITAVYSGDSDTAASQTTALTQLVDQDQTATTVTTSASPSAFGQSVTFTATVSVTAPGSGTPTGTINFFDGTTLLNSNPATLSVAGGREQAAFSTASLAVNPNSGHSITAAYSGDSETTASASTAVVQPVDQDQTATSVATSQSPSVFGQSVTFTATVNVTAPGSSTPTGTINFLDGTTLLNSDSTALSLVGGHYQATFSTAALAVNSTGGHTITALYSGDPDTLGSQSTPLAQLVDADATTTMLDSSANPSVQGDQVTLTATVAPLFPGSGTAAGSVTFTEGPTVLGNVTLSGGVATFIDSTLTPGTHTITATYDGSPGYDSSESAALSQSIHAVTTTSLGTSATIASLGQSMTFSVTVTAPSGTSVPTGSVTFFDGSNAIGSVPLGSTGAATFTFGDLPLGVQQISASYGGDASHAPSTSNLQSVTILTPARVIGPTITSVKRYGKNNQNPTYLLLSFSAPLDPATAELVANYSIVGPIKKHKTPTHGPRISSAVYNSATITVTLVIPKKWSASSQWRLTVNGTTPAGVTGSERRALTGAGSQPSGGGSLPGTNYVAIITHKNLAGPSRMLPKLGLVTLSRPIDVSSATTAGHDRTVFVRAAGHPAGRQHFLALARRGRPPAGFTPA